MFAIYRHAAGIGREYVSIVPGTVLVTPATFTEVTHQGPLIEPEVRKTIVVSLAVLGEAGEVIQDEVTESVIVSPAVYGADMVLREPDAPAVYRDETTPEMIARRGAEGLLPDWPWLDWLLVPEGSEASQVDVSRLSVANWGDPASVAIAPRVYADQELRDLARDKRRAVIAGGTTVVVGGVAVPVWADAATQTALTGLVIAGQAGLLPALVDWRGRDGETYQVAPAALMPLAAGVLNFVQSAFSIEAAVVAAIKSGAITSPAQIEAAAWPSIG